MAAAAPAAAAPEPAYQSALGCGDNPAGLNGSMRRLEK